MKLRSKDVKAMKIRKICSDDSNKEKVIYFHKKWEEIVFISDNKRKAVILNAEHSGVVLDDKKDLVIFSGENGAVVVNVKEEETFKNAAVPAIRKVDKKDLGNAGGEVIKENFDEKAGVEVIGREAVAASNEGGTEVINKEMGDCRERRRCSRCQE